MHEPDRPGQYGSLDVREERGERVGESLGMGQRRRVPGTGDLLHPSVRDVLGHVPHTEPVLDEVRGMTDARWIVISRGSEGVIAWCEWVTERRSATTIATVLDRIGAGDAMAAGFLDGILDGDARLPRSTTPRDHGDVLRYGQLHGHEGIQNGPSHDQLGRSQSAIERTRG
ncbi:MAG: PfkB family carbohydrate kinase [Trueperaceae bacterium]